MRKETNNSLYAYRISAMEGATHVDVLLACYDAIAEDIRMAGEAAAVGDIEARCRHSEHAFVVLGHLENWLPLLEDAVLEESLSRFYGYLRRQLLQLQSSVRTAEFADLAMDICETRAVWQKKTSMMSTVEVGGRSHAEPDSGLAVETQRLYCSA